MMSKNNSNLQKGFTLIELMTAVSLFIIVMTISMSSLLGVFDANRKSRSIKAVMNNLNLAVESMSKEMRYGSNYHCGSSGNESSPNSCSSGSTYLTFLSSGGAQLTYRLNASTLEKREDNAQFIPLISSDVVIDKFVFYVLGAEASDGLQPKVIMELKGHVGTGRNRSDFNLETQVSQRKRDS